jgi:hypothetical protein
MAGQIETNEKITAIKEKNAELSANAAAGKAELASATSKLTELKTSMESLIPTLPVIPSIQGELSNLGSLDTAGLLSKVSSLITKFSSAVPGLSDLMGSMGLSSFPPTIDISAITEKIPNVEEIDGKLVTQPAESLVAEDAPAAPVEKVAVEIDYEELSIELLKRSNSWARGLLWAHERATWPESKSNRYAIKYIWVYNHRANSAVTAGTTLEELGKYKNVGSKGTYERLIAGYTGAPGYDVNLMHTTHQERYNTLKNEHAEGDNILDWTAVLKKWWENVQKNV